MVETRPEASPIAKEAGKPGDNSRDDGASYRSPELGSGAARHPTEHLAGLGQEGMRTTAAEASMAAGSAVRSGSVVAESVQGIAKAWARYAEEVVRHTAEASRALLSARTPGEMLEVQAKLMRDNMQAFLDQSARIAELAGKLASRPFEALREAGSDRTRP